MEKKKGKGLLENNDINEWFKWITKFQFITIKIVVVQS